MEYRRNEEVDGLAVGRNVHYVLVERLAELGTDRVRSIPTSNQGVVVTDENQQIPDGIFLVDHIDPCRATGTGYSLVQRVLR